MKKVITIFAFALVFLALAVNVSAYYSSCSREDLRGKTCSDFGFRGGTLGCNNEGKFDTSQCYSYCTNGYCYGSPKGGYGWVSCYSIYTKLSCEEVGCDWQGSGNLCEGDNLNGRICPNFISLFGNPFISGVLECSDNCGFDTSGCEEGINCGNGDLDYGEQCEGTNFGGESCLSQNFSTGDLKCKSDCTIDTSGCSNSGGGDGSCNNPFTKCEGIGCVDLSSDPFNCGACGLSCEGGTCSNGFCCGSGLTKCEGINSCVDLKTDTANCGACDNWCHPGQECKNGKCECPSGQTYCSSANACVDLQTDSKNCGQCGNDCSSSSCQMGICKGCNAPSGSGVGTGMAVYQLLGGLRNVLTAKVITGFASQGEDGCCDPADPTKCNPCGDTSNPDPSCGTPCADAGEKPDGLPCPSPNEDILQSDWFCNSEADPDVWEEWPIPDNCPSDCVSDCTGPEEKICEGNGVKTCGAAGVLADGVSTCYKWGSVAPCGQGETCNSNTNTCENVCEVGGDSGGGGSGGNNINEKNNPGIVPQVNPSSRIVRHGVSGGSGGADIGFILKKGTDTEYYIGKEIPVARKKAEEYLQSKGISKDDPKYPGMLADRILTEIMKSSANMWITAHFSLYSAYWVAIESTVKDQIASEFGVKPEDLKATGIRAAFGDIISGREPLPKSGNGLIDGTLEQTDNVAKYNPAFRFSLFLTTSLIDNPSSVLDILGQAGAMVVDVPGLFALVASTPEVAKDVIILAGSMPVDSDSPGEIEQKAETGRQVMSGWYGFFYNIRTDQVVSMGAVAGAGAVKKPVGVNIPKVNELKTKIAGAIKATEKTPPKIPVVPKEPDAMVMSKLTGASVGEVQAAQEAVMDIKMVKEVGSNGVAKYVPTVDGTLETRLNKLGGGGVNDAYDLGNGMVLRVQKALPDIRTDFNAWKDGAGAGGSRLYDSGTLQGPDGVIKYSVSEKVPGVVLSTEAELSSKEVSAVAKSMVRDVERGGSITDTRLNQGLYDSETGLYRVIDLDYWTKRGPDKTMDKYIRELSDPVEGPKIWGKSYDKILIEFEKGLVELTMNKIAKNVGNGLEFGGIQQMGSIRMFEFEFPNPQNGKPVTFYVDPMPDGSLPDQEIVRQAFEAKKRLFTK